MVEQEVFQTFATKHYEDINLRELVFDAQPIKLIKDACPIARAQAAKQVILTQSWSLILSRHRCPLQRPESKLIVSENLYELAEQLSILWVFLMFASKKVKPFFVVPTSTEKLVQKDP